MVHNASLLENNLVLAVGEKPQQHSEQWVLNSSCSYHMCQHISQFVTYEEKFGGNVLMGNNPPCKSVGIGCIQIRMHVRIIRTLSKVCHVLDLQKILVFVGAMDSKGFSCWLKVRLC